MATGGVRANQAERQKACVLWAAYERFLEEHRGAVPAWLAAQYLDMTPQGVFQAAERGWLAYFQHGRNRLYSRKDLVAYRWNCSRKFADTRVRPPHPPGNARYEFDPDSAKGRALARAQGLDTPVYYK
ncbi:hypothetical protein llg_36030 [Luteolibacter sp. LG18]|nr:hypothetical protein llg_36030 [Luteolibacter sp. LG18]